MLCKRGRARRLYCLRENAQALFGMILKSELFNNIEVCNVKQNSMKRARIDGNESK